MHPGFYRPSQCVPIGVFCVVHRPALLLQTTGLVMMHLWIHSCPTESMADPHLHLLPQLPLACPLLWRSYRGEHGRAEGGPRGSTSLRTIASVPRFCTVLCHGCLGAQCSTRSLLRASADPVCGVFVLLVASSTNANPSLAGPITHQLCSACPYSRSACGCVHWPCSPQLQARTMRGN